MTISTMMISRLNLPRFFNIILGGVFFTAIFISLSIAQDFPNQFNQNLPQHKKDLPEFTTPDTGPKIVLPPPPAPDENKLSTIPFVYVENYEFIGNTVFSNETLQQIAEPFTKRKISTKELHELRNLITRYYINKGYINSGAVLPDQKVSNHVIKYNIIEGRLNELEIVGTTHLQNGYIIKRIHFDPEKTFNIIELQEKLQLLHQDPVIKKLNGELSPGLKPGEASLKVKVTESNPLKFSAQYSNESSPSSGSTGPEFVFQHLNIFGWADAFSSHFSHTNGSDKFAVDYSVPINSKGTRLTLSYDYTKSKIIEEPFDLIDIKSESDDLGISFAHPVMKHLDRELILSVSGEKRQTKTYLFGKPYSFVESTDSGEINISVARISIDWNIYKPTQVLAIRSVLSTGLDIFETTKFVSEPDGQFISWLGQVQWSKRIDAKKADQLILKSSFQLSDSRLPSMERFSVGGINTVRGYRENQLVRDNGFVASAEYRYPVGRIALPTISKDLTDGIVQLAPFFDMGISWNQDEPSKAETISSVGLGLRWDPSKKIHAQIYFGKSLNPIDNTSYNLQDSGVHFLFKCRFL